MGCNIFRRENPLTLKMGRRVSVRMMGCVGARFRPRKIEIVESGNGTDIDFCYSQKLASIFTSGDIYNES